MKQNENGTENGDGSLNDNNQIQQSSNQEEPRNAGPSKNLSIEKLCYGQYHEG